MIKKYNLKYELEILTKCIDDRTRIYLIYAPNESYFNGRNISNLNTTDFSNFTKRYKRSDSNNVPYFQRVVPRSGTSELACSSPAARRASARSRVAGWSRSAWAPDPTCRGCRVGWPASRTQGSGGRIAEEGERWIVF